MNACHLLLILLMASASNRQEQLAAAREQSWAGDADAAVRLYRDYLANWPDDREAWLEYARNLGWQGNHAAGLEQLDRLEKRFGETEETRRDRARLLVGGGWPRAARRLLDNNLLEAAPDDAGLHGLAAIAFGQSGEPALAGEHLEQARALDRRDLFVQEAGRLVETPQSSSVEPAARVYQDSDAIEIRREALRFELELGPRARSRLSVFSVREELEVDLGKKGAELSLATSDLQPIDYHKYGIGLSHQRSGWQGDVALGRIELASRQFLVGHFNLALTPADSWRLELAGQREIFAVSPRAVELAIVREGGSLRLKARPSPRFWLDLSGSYDRFSDGVDRFELHFAPRRQALRRERLNLDLGLRAQLFAFSEDLHHGYYAPELYQRYTATFWIYWKQGRATGTSLVVDAGFYRDDRDKAWRFGGDLALETSFGYLRHLEMIFRLGLSKNLRGAAGAFDGQSAGVFLRGRF